MEITQHVTEPRPARPDARPLLVVFGGRRDGRTRRLEGHVAQVLQRRGNHETFRILNVDVDRRPDLVDRFRIEKLPALAVVEGKKLRLRIEKPKGCAEIQAALRPWLA